MAHNTALQELIEDIKANIAGCACNLNEAGLSEKERAHYNGAIIAGKDALRKATELLPKERQDISDNVCSFLDWIHSEGWMVFRSTPEIIWFKEGAYAMKTNEQLYYYFTYTKNK